MSAPDEGPGPPLRKVHDVALQLADSGATPEELCRRYPEWRLGQLVANVAGWADQEVWDVEDEQLLQAARLHLEQVTPSEPITPRTNRRT